MHLFLLFQVIFNYLFNIVSLRKLLLGDKNNIFNVFYLRFDFLKILQIMLLLNIVIGLSIVER